MGTRSKGTKPVTLEQLAEEVHQLRTRIDSVELRNTSPQWWIDQAGRFANDPIFDRVVELGRQQRRMLDKQKPRKKKRARS